MSLRVGVLSVSIGRMKENNDVATAALATKVGSMTDERSDEALLVGFWRQ